MGSEELASIKELRQQRGWSLARLGKRCGYSPSYLGRIEQGWADAPPSTLAKIRAALNPADQRWCLETSVLLQWRDQMAQRPDEGLHGAYAILIIEELLRLRGEQDRT